MDRVRGAIEIACALAFVDRSDHDHAAENRDNTPVTDN
jgi:hypothetical protein